MAPPPSPAGRRLLPEDLAVWAEYLRHVAPRGGRPRPMPEPVTAPPAPAVSAPAPLPARRAAAAPRAVVVGLAPGGLDRASWERLRAGRTAPTRTLDLHGRTAGAAHAALHDFLATAQAEGVRCVEIVTGRGSGPEGGILRRELPHWLNLPALRPLVLAATHPHAANPGAVRVLVRRRR